MTLDWARRCPAPTRATTTSPRSHTTTADITAEADHRQLRGRRQGLRRQRRRHGDDREPHSRGTVIAATTSASPAARPPSPTRTSAADKDGHPHRGDPVRRRCGQLRPRPRSPRPPPTSRRRRSPAASPRTNKVYDGNTTATVDDQLARRRRSAATTSRSTAQRPASATRTSAPTRRSRRPARAGAAPTPATTRLSSARPTDDCRHHAPSRSPAASPPTTRSTTAPPAPSVDRAASLGGDSRRRRRHAHRRHSDLRQQERRQRQDGDARPARRSPAADAGNYTLTLGDTTTADITAKPITGSFTAGEQGLRRQHQRHGRPTARSTGTITGDDVSLTGGTRHVRQQERRRPARP